MAVALETVVKQLTDSGIIAQGQLERFVPPKAQPKDADELIAQLVKENHLTKFQAAQVAAGKSKSLILGEYTILDKIGAGGMGQVFKALHRRMDRTVAIKVLPPATTKDAAAVARFEREVRAAAKLNHHNIVAAHDAGQANGVHFLVMEYVEGQDLSATVKKNGPLPVAKATNYILQAARGLEFAHKRGVIHRDIKPANLLLDHEGTVKILDMGLARIESDGNVAAQAELTGTGTIMGTVDYMAPEQGMSTKHADARADIYSLGCSLYYLIAGKATYEGETVAAKLVAHHTQPIPDLRTVHPNVSDQLEAVFKKMVAKRIEDRYQTMTEVIADLEQLGGNSGTVSNPIAATAIFDNQEFSFLKNAVATPKLSQATKKEPIAKSSNGKQPPWKNTKVLIGAGAAGFLFLLLGVIVIVRNKDGKEVARLEVADGNSVEVQPTTPKATPTTNSLATVAPSTPTKKTPTPADLVGSSATPTSTDQTFNGHRYQFFKKVVSWDGAKAEAEALGGHLVTISSKAEDDWIRQQFGGLLTGNNTGFWLGASQATPDAEWKWVTGEPFSYANWGRNEPNCRDKSDENQPPYYLNFFHSGTYSTLFGWNDTALSPSDRWKTQIIGYLVEWEKDDGSTPTSPPLQTLDLLASLDLQQDRVPAANFTGANNWTRTGDVVTYTTDGKSGRVTLPVDARNASDFEIVSNVRRLSGNSVFTFDITTSDQLETGVDITIGGGIQLKVENDRRQKIGDWPAIVKDGGTIAIRVRRELNDESGSVDVSVDGIPAAHWQGAMAKIGKPWESHPSFPGKPSLRIFCFKDSYEFKSWQLRVFAGQAVSLRSSAIPPLAKAPFDAAQAKAHQQAWAKHLGTEVVKPNSVGMQMTLIPPGEFMMGSSDADITLALKIAEEAKLDAAGVKRLQEERPQHRVRITQPFRLAAHEVTIGQFAKFVEQTKYKTQAEEFGGDSLTVKPEEVRPETLKLTWRTPGQAVTDDSPVTQVSWNDAVAFCNWLSEEEKLEPCYQRDADSWTLLPKANGYRLPAEAEWEYACRAGTATQYSFGDDWQEHDQYGWTQRNAGGRPHAVGSLPANPFGLYDMHGNVWEWCQDGYDGKWYEQSPQDDPTGPSMASTRVIRGGSWPGMPAYGRSSYRLNGPPSHRGNDRGFRPALSSVGAQSSTASVTPQPAVPAASGKLFMHDTAFPQWMAQVQAMPAEQQIEAVRKKLMELNPGFDGKLTGGSANSPPTIENGAVIQLGFFSDKVTDLSPLRAFTKLKNLYCPGSPESTKKSDLSDLGPLQGMSLTGLNIGKSSVTDLSPLEGMPLATFYCNDSKVLDLSSLRGMPLTKLECVNTQVSDLSPLRGMPLLALNCFGTRVSALLPLEHCGSLKQLILQNTKVTAASVTALQKALPDCKIEWDDPAKATPTQPAASNGKLFMHDPAFPQWMKDVQAMPAEEQVKAVSKKMMELNPGFDGVVMNADGKVPPKIENGAVTELSVLTDRLTDISPVRALVKLRLLKCFGSSPGKGILADLSPLQGMPLESLSSFNTPVTELSSLKGMPLTKLYFHGSQVFDLSPLQGMKLTNLGCKNTPVSDLSPLKGMPLRYLDCQDTPVSNLLPLQDCKSLSVLIALGTKVTPAAVAALQKALPNCKIEWDDPTKTKTPQPTASGTK